MHARLLTVERALIIAVVAAVTCAFASASASAQTTWHVPADFPTIQEAIDAASSKGGDEIIVAPGTYNEAINFNSKAVHLRSSDGPEVTIIDATGVARRWTTVSVVTCDSGEGPDTILDGFTITGGTGTDIFATVGGGMYNASSSPSVMNCRFVSNTAWNGGGMYNAGDSSPVVINCLFEGNSAGLSGGAIENAWGGTAQIADTQFCENQPGHIVGTWDDLGGNEFFVVCPWTEPVSAHVPAEYGSIQAAIQNVPWGSEIIVAPGTYNEAINFNGKAVHLRSSDGPEVTIIDASGLNTSVVKCESGEGPDTILDGFTITGGTGQPPGGPLVAGGGMRNFNTSPTVMNCIFINNTADRGGGMYNSNSSPTVINSVFTGNAASNRGGAMFITNNSSPLLVNCTLDKNSATTGGGIWSAATSLPSISDTLLCENVSCDIVGPWNDLGGNEFCDSITELTFVPGDYDTIQQAIDAVNCEAEIVIAPGIYHEAINFLGKPIHLRSSGGPEVTTIDASSLNTNVVRCVSSEGPGTILDGFTITGGLGPSGAGMRNSGSNPTVMNCIFAGNSTTGVGSGWGGGMFNLNSHPTVANCWFAGNTAWLGGGLYNNNTSSATVTNCVFEGNMAVSHGGGMYNVDGSSATVTNSVFEGNTAGVAGGAMFNVSSGILIGTTSFCDNDPDHIDGPFEDHGGNEFLDDCPSCPGDLTGDGNVGVGDLLALISEWGACDDPDDCPADLTGDGHVGVSDLLVLIAQWGACQ